MIERGAGPANDAKAISYAPGARVAYPKGKPVELCPWIRTEALETHVIINDLGHSLARNVVPVSGYWERRLDNWTGMERVVDQYAADGALLARHSKRLASDEVWRLSLGRARGPSLEYGLLVFTGPYTLCHFQLVGPRTFATCHSRRFPLEQAARPRHRKVLFPRQPWVMLSLFFMNLGEGANRITVFREVRGKRVASATVEIPRLGCHVLCLNQLRGETAAAEECEWFVVTSSHLYDYYTIIENGETQEDTFSIQHVK